MSNAVNELESPAVTDDPARTTGAAIGPPRWITSVRDGVALMMIAGVVSAVMAYFPVGRYYHEAPAHVLVAIVHMALALLPATAGLLAAWLVTRPAKDARRKMSGWLRWSVRVSAGAGILIPWVFAVAPHLWDTFHYDRVHRIVTLLLVLANGLLYFHLALLARRMSRPLLVVPCMLLAVLLPALLMWANLWRLAIGLETYGRLMLLTAVPVIGTGLPQTARYAGMFVDDQHASAGATTSQVLLLYAIAILAMLVLLEVRRVMKEQLQRPAPVD